MAINISFECLYSLAVGRLGQKSGGEKFQSLILQCGNEGFKSFNASGTDASSIDRMHAGHKGAHQFQMHGLFYTARPGREFRQQRPSHAGKTPSRNNHGSQKKLKTQRQRTNRLYVLHRKEPLNDSLRAAYKLSRNLYHRSLRAAKDTMSYLSTLGYTMLGKERKGGYAWWKRAKARLPP